jgi:hypothetical protein
MERHAVLLAARSALAEVTDRAAALIRSLPDLDRPLHGGSTWSVREAAVHLLDNEDYTEMANGVPSPLTSVALRDVAEANAQFIADIPESDPGKVAGLITDAGARFLRSTEDRPGDQPVTFHGGLGIDLAALVSIALGETILHSYDIASAVGAPWPIHSRHAALVVDGYTRMDPVFVNPATTTGFTAAYRLRLREGDVHTVRFAQGQCVISPSDADPADCEISADPVAYLLVRAGRLSPWAAFALGLISGGGSRPDLAARYPDLFVFP